LYHHWLELTKKHPSRLLIRNITIQALVKENKVPIANIADLFKISISHVKALNSVRRHITLKTEVELHLEL